MTDTISSTIDDAGRLVIPKQIRDAAGLTGGTGVEFRLRDDRVIELRPRSVRVRVEERGGVHVAVPDDDVPTMSKSIVDRTTGAVHGAPTAEGPSAAAGYRSERWSCTAVRPHH